MTCIVGMVHGGRVHLGGDSAATDATSRTCHAGPKVFSRGDFVIGYQGSFRAGQLLEFGLEIPDLPQDGDLLRYMVAEFVPAVREVLIEGVEFLVGTRGRLFKVQSDYSVLESLDGYDACGSGEGYALGVLHATQNLYLPERLGIALAAAAHHSPGVSAPFHYVSTY